MAATILPTHLTLLPISSFTKPSTFPIFSSLSTSSFSTIRLPISSSPFGSGYNVSPLILRSKPAPANSTPEETAEPAPEETQEQEEEEKEEEKPPRKPIVKLGDIMGILNKRAIEAAEKERPVPDIRTGDVVEIKLEVPENRRRASTYKGIVISKQNAGIHTTIRIRRIIAGIGVEIVFPVYSPNIKELKVVSHRKVRRARLYYLRDKLPRLSTFK